MTESSKPVGKRNYIVSEGECVESIAFTHGFFPETLWNHDRNSELRAARKDPNVLFPGDRVFIPSLRKGVHLGDTNKKQRYRRKGVPSFFNLTLIAGGEPRENVNYRLVIENEEHRGVTDADGRIEKIPISPSARYGELYIEVSDDPGEEEYYELDIGGMDPFDSIQGLQKRLINLGFDCNEDGVISEETNEAITEFQSACGLEITRKFDENTIQTLKDKSGD